VTSLLLAALLSGAATAGVVFDDANASGRRDPGEGGLAGVVVTDGRSLTVTGADGAYRLDAATGLHVFVVTPGDRHAVDGWYQPRRETQDFALAQSQVGDEWRFAHLSDTHIQAGNAWRTRLAFSLVRQHGAELALVSGDLIKDALRVDEATARGYFALYAQQIREAGLAVWSAPGNHDVFGIERHKSLVPETHPAYGKAMFEQMLGPRYHAFNRGRVHFIVLDTIGIDDINYYGFVDALQLDWIRQDLAHLAPGTPIVTLCHIPLRSGEPATEYADGSLLAVNGQSSFRHVVRNHKALSEILRPHNWTLALQGHMHKGERLRQWDGDGATRYHTAPAVDRQGWAPWPSGMFVYTVRGAAIDDGELVIIDEAGDGK